MPSRLNGEARKSLRVALFASLTAHGLLLLAALPRVDSSLSESGVAAKILQVRVVGPKLSPASQSIPSEASTRPSQVSQKTKVSAETHPATSSAENAAVSSAVSVSAIATLPSEGIAMHSSGSLRLGSVGAEVSTASVAANGNQKSSAPAPFADDLRAYQLGLATRARRFRIYPALALEQNLSGRAEVEVVLQPWSPPRFQLKKTSGHDVLDQAALEMLRRASPSVGFPDSLRERAFSFVLPVEFVPPP